MVRAAGDAGTDDSTTEGSSCGDGRYELVRVLGRGGVGEVFEAIDRALGRRIALKRLLVQDDAQRQQRHLELFESEFHALAQLAHPRVVEVYDFGIDGAAAYYTMELLDGGDLQSLSPLPWREACAIARELCSVLSLLHSRRLVHRDISARNVRRTANGLSKLIDFGALAPIGPSRLLVGTPPCSPPESVHLQSLDGRTDLYGLGATLYYVLTGRYPYNARSFSVLVEAWQLGFVRPGELVPDIPAALDGLVVDLLRLEPDARPANAADVMQRLAAIDDSAYDEHLQVTQAYLSTPSLVGRRHALARIQRRLSRTVQRHGRSIVIDGPAGSGRSRLLDAALLDASLRGLTTLRADASDAVSGEFGVLRALTGQLLSLLPELTRATAAPHAALLAQLLPELANADDLALDESLDPRRLRPRLQRTLLTWLAELSRQRPLAIAVDDFHRIDEPSAALLAALAGEIVPYSICLLCTVASDSDDEPSAASKLLVASSTQVPLQNLNEAQSWQLFASLFGDQPKLRLLAHRAHASCAGNPRDLLALAQHMIDRGVVRYEAGAFSVAAPIEAIELPRDMTQALQARIDALPEAARRLACALALCPDRSFSLNECCALVACDLRALRSQIDALVRADVVRRNGEQLQLSQRDFAPILERAVAVPERRVIHERLANIFARRGDEFRTVQQWFAADETARALDLLVRYIETEAETSAQDPGSLRFADIRSPAPNWIGTYERAMRACIELGRPRRDWFTFLNRRISVGGLLGIYEPAEVATLFEQLAADSGLADWARLDPNLDEHTRIASALQSTQTRYDETAEEQRVFDPATALRHIARTVISTLAMITGALDVDSLVALPNLRAFASLTPALRALADLTAGMIARFTGRLDEARAVYKQLLDAVGAPDRSGFDALRAEYVQLGVMNALGMIEAGLGLESALVWAARLEAHPVYEVNGVIIRMLHALYQTDFVAADGCKVLVQRLRILSSSRQMMEGGHLLWEVQALAIAEDLTRLRQVRDEIAPLAERYPAWRPVAYYAIGEYHRIRRAGDKALAELETALELARPGVHQLWPAIAASHLLALDSLGRIVEAISLGARYLADARERLAFEPDELVLADALVRARGGDAGAVDRVDGVIERLQRDQIAGLHLGYAHEMRARIALALDDRAAFERHAQACRGLYVERRNAALIAKAERLWQRSRGANSEAPSGPPDSAARSRVASALEECPDSAARAQVALSIVAAHGGAVDGCLFGLFGGALSCLARTANLMISDELVEQAKSYLTAQAHAFGTTATGSVRPSQRRSDSADENAQRYMPILLSHQREGRTTISGVVLLARGSGVALAYPTQLATEVSELLASYDDVEPLVVSD